MLPKSFDATNGAFTVADRSLAPVSKPNPQFQGVSDLKTYFELVEQYAKGSPWYFRGEPTEYTNPCLPKFARPYVDGSLNPDDLDLFISPQKAGNGIEVIVSCMTKQEIEIIESFRSNPPPDDYFEKLVGSVHEGAGWLSFAQHYGERTRLLDVTANPLVALYFACNKYENDDGFVWMFPQPVNIHGLRGVLDYREAFDPGLGGADGARAISYYKAGQLHTFHPNADVVPLATPFVLRIEEPNKRIIAQSGAFLWCPRPLQELTHNGFVVRIASAAKPDLLAKLSAFGIHNTGLGF